MESYNNFLAEFSLVKEPTEISLSKITSSETASDYIRQFFPADLAVREHFFVLYLNQSNNTIGFQHISTGGITGTVVDVRLIMKNAINCLATGMILVHNHPSGSLKPSEADKKITDKIKDASKLFDIAVLDHIILTEESYFSFADNNILN